MLLAATQDGAAQSYYAAPQQISESVCLCGEILFSSATHTSPEWTDNAMRLADIAQVIRSKNAGPRRLTLDIMFGSDRDFQRVAQSPALSPESLAALYGVTADEVTVIPYPQGRAIKIALARRVMAGDPGDCDVYGAQQHAPLLGIEL